MKIAAGVVALSFVILAGPAMAGPKAGPKKPQDPTVKAALK